MKPQETINTAKAVSSNIIIFAYDPEKVNHNELIDKIIKSKGSYGDIKLIYITCNRQAVFLAEKLKGLGNYMVLDCISRIAGADKKIENTKYIASPTNLTSLSIAFGEQMKKSKALAVIDSVSTFLIYNDLKIFIKFLAHIIGVTRSYRSGMIIISTVKDLELEGIESIIQMVDSVLK